MTLTPITPPVPTLPEIRYDYGLWIWWAVPILCALVLAGCLAVVVSEWRRKTREAPPQPQETPRRRKGRTHP